jgi:hypothetical protein
MRQRRFAALMLPLALAACSSVGPMTVPHDRIGYITAVGDSWKEQTLLNVVRIRYGDAPSFMDVASVISGYTIQGQLSAAGTVSSDLTATIPKSLVTLGGSASYQDRPTITYMPPPGEKFTRSLLRPIPPAAIFELVQAGYPSDAILQITVRAINGIYNRSSTGGRAREPDPEFYPLIQAMRRLQLSGSVTLRIENRGEDELGTLIFAPRRSPEAEKDLQFVLKTLGIRSDKSNELNLTFGALLRTDREIALLTRSMLEILLEVAAGIDVPPEHVAEGRTVAASRVATAPASFDRPLVRVSSGATPPADPFAAVHYRDTWYWIADDDFASKRIFTFLMMFFSLAETGVTSQAPVLTVPAN